MFAKIVYSLSSRCIYKIGIYFYFYIIYIKLYYRLIYILYIKNTPIKIQINVCLSPTIGVGNKNAQIFYIIIFSDKKVNLVGNLDKL